MAAIHKSLTLAAVFFGVLLGCTSAVFVPEYGVAYRLKTAPNKCLTGNNKLGGAVFLAPCWSPGRNQQWYFRNAPTEGYYYLSTVPRDFAQSLSTDR